MRRMMPAARNVEQAFTFVELLIVIGIIAILAGLWPWPGIPMSKTTAKKYIARTEEGNLVAGINQYYATYSHLPVSSNAVAAAGTNDFTFGTVSKTPAGSGRLSSIMVACLS